LYNIAIHVRKEVKHTMLGSQELIIVLIIVVVLFGATRLPKLGSGMGQAIRNFKKGISESREIEEPKDSTKKEETQNN
jgi:sec-independent protein translocase protein TatA